MPGFDGQGQRWRFGFSGGCRHIEVCAGGRRAACNKIYARLGPGSKVTLEEVQANTVRLGEPLRAVRTAKLAPDTRPLYKPTVEPSAEEVARQNYHTPRYRL